MRPLRLKSKCLLSGIQLGASKRSGAMYKTRRSVEATVMTSSALYNVLEAVLAADAAVAGVVALDAVEAEPEAAASSGVASTLTFENTAFSMTFASWLHTPRPT